MKRTFHKKQRSRYAGHKSRIKKSDNWSKPKDGLKIFTQYPYSPSPVSRNGNGNGNGHHDRIFLRSYDLPFLRDTVLVAHPRLSAAPIVDTRPVRFGHPIEKPTYGRHPGLRRYRRARRIIDAVIADCR